MGRRGFAPEPTKLKIAKGETRPSRINYEEPQPKLTKPRMPPDMDAGAQAVWKRVMREMGHLDVILAADTDTLRLYCEAVSRYVWAQERYTKAPLINRAGTVVKSPAHQLVRDNAEQIRVLARELGLTPSARAGLHIRAADQAKSIDTEIGLPPRLSVVGGTYE